MAFNGIGTFVRLHNWQQDAANGIDISAPEMDGEDNGFAAGLSLCVTRDGQGQMAADFLPSAANTYKCGSVTFPWSQGNFTSLQVNGIPVFGGAPINTQSGTTYTIAGTDAGGSINATNAAAKTITIAANSVTPIAASNFITLINSGAGAMSIQINTDTLTLAGTTSTGTRSLSQNGVATLFKLTSTSWLISGIGLS